jgi:AcrR family transcriptional regulator
MTGRDSSPGRAAVWAISMSTQTRLVAVLRIADREGLDAVSMRRVAGELGVGAASLYRYMETRDELLDLMTDATAAEYDFPPPTGDWLADLVAVGEQSRTILRRHPWLAALSLTRPVIGPNGLTVIEHILAILAGRSKQAPRLPAPPIRPPPPIRPTATPTSSLAS